MTSFDDSNAAPARRGRAPWVALAAATVFVTALFAIWQWAAHSRYEWRITDVVAPAGVLAASGEVRVGSTLRGGPLRTAGGSEVGLQLGGALRLRLLGDSAVELPLPPARWYSGEILVTLRAGEVYGTTGSGQLDLPLRVVARDAEAEIQGTTFAILQTPDFTAVCLWRGSLQAASRGTGAKRRLALPAESKVLFYPDGTVSDVLPLDPLERLTLQMMADDGVLSVPAVPE
jgi:ferric-dicitrate binding protein FerR (iron transport regulator)